jgi:acyl carrier protein
MLRCANDHRLTIGVAPKKRPGNKPGVKRECAMSNNMNAATNGGVADVVRRMLAERSINAAVTADADLREIGLTSMDMVDLVLSVECALDLHIPEAQITPANFRSIAAIDALVAALRKSAAGVDRPVTIACQA